jgi:hypothetical protein
VGSASRRVSLDGRTLKTEVSVSLARRRNPAADYPELRSFCRQADALYDEMVTLEESR